MGERILAGPGLPGAADLRLRSVCERDEFLAGLLSVLLFPLAALTILRGAGAGAGRGGGRGGGVDSEAEPTSVTT